MLVACVRRQNIVVSLHGMAVSFLSYYIHTFFIGHRIVERFLIGRALLLYETYFLCFIRVVNRILSVSLKQSVFVMLVQFFISFRRCIVD